MASTSQGAWFLRSKARKPSRLLGGLFLLVAHQFSLVGFEVFFDHLQLFKFYRNAFLAQIPQVAIMAQGFSYLDDFDMEIANLPELSDL